MNSKKRRTLVVVGFRVDKKHNFITGQAALVDLFITIMSRNGYKVIPVSLNYRLKGSSTVSKPNFLRFIDYLPIFAEIAFKIITHPKGVLYISPGSSVAGSLRDFFSVCMAKLFGYKVIIQQFGGSFRSFYNSQRTSIKKIIAWYYSKASIITVEGKKTKSQFQGFKCFNRIFILHNGLPETNAKTPNLPRIIGKEKPLRLFFLSNMIESKGYLDVLESINILVNEDKISVYAVFAGKFMKAADDSKFKTTEEARTYFFNQIKKCGLQDNVTYYPSLFGDEKASVFEQSHFFLLPSYYSIEGAPTAILEALAYGCVPIVTKQGLIPEIVSDDNCIFVQKRNPKQIADAIKRCYNNETIYNKLSLNGYQHYKDNYTVAAYEKNWLNLYRKEIENEE